MPEVIYTNVIRTAKLGMRVLGQPIDITGLEHLPRTGPALLALNHIGYVDFIYGGFAPDRIGRRVRFMAKRELFKELKTGAVRIAQRAGAPLIPMVLWGTQRLMTKDHDKDFSRGKVITIRIGAPIPLTGADPIGETRALREALQELLAESIASYPQHEPGAWWVPASYGGSAPTPERAAELDAAEKRERAARRAAARVAAKRNT